MPNPDKKEWTSYFFRGLPLNEELSAMMAEIISEFYDSQCRQFNYSACKNSKAYNQLQLLAQSLNTFDPMTMQTEQERKAFWLNLYNALIIHLVIIEKVDKSILQVKEFFTSFRYQLKGIDVTLDEIEHGILRANSPNYMQVRRPFRKDSPGYTLMLELDPRIHMALFCASMSCADLKAYFPDTIDQELDTTVIKSLEKLVRIEGRKIFLPKCFMWYSNDFGGKEGSLDFVSRYHPDSTLSQFIKNNKNHLKISWLTFDWSLNKG